MGVHPIRSSEAIALWLLRVDIKYLRPSVGDLTARACVPPERHDRLRRRFLSGKPVIETLTVEFFNGEIKIAEAAATYFARQSQRLRTEGISTDNVNALYEFKLTSSAELIAGVRARETGKLFEDPYALDMAGQHGVAIAERFCRRLPQLGGMVASRTHHGDKAVRDFVAEGGRNIVLLGVGWDTRPFRLDLPAGTHFFELDFPTTLNERRKRIESLGMKTSDGVVREEVPIDLRTMTVQEVLEGRVRFDEPILLVWEGVTMYLEDDDIRNTLEGLAPLLRHENSRVWMDLVDRETVEHPERCAPEARSFLESMQALGEPFTFGVDSVEEFLADHGYACREVVPSNAFLDDKDDPIYQLYHFCLASPAPVDAPAEQRRIDRPEEMPRERHVGEVRETVDVKSRGRAR